MDVLVRHVTQLLNAFLKFRSVRSSRSTFPMRLTLVERGCLTQHIELEFDSNVALRRGFDKKINLVPLALA